MTEKPETPETSPPSLNRIFWFSFWITIGVLVAVVLALTFSARQKANKALLEQARDIVVMERVVGRALDEGFPATRQMIDPLIDQAFAPVYDNIPAFADWHYSVLGEYTELTMAATGNLETALNDRLFPGLDERLQVALDALDKNLREEFSQAISDSITAEVATLPGNRQEVYRSALVLSLDNTTREFSAALATRGVGAVTGAAGTIVAAAIIKPIAKKLITSIAAKTAVKTGAKATGLGSGAAAGASVGALGGPLGAAAGGIVGAVGGWLLVDTVVVNVDELLNREEYEAELRLLVDEQKRAIKADIRLAIDDLTRPVAGPGGKTTPSDLMQEGD